MRIGGSVEGGGPVHRDVEVEATPLFARGELGASTWII